MLKGMIFLTQQQPQNKMGVMPVNKLLITMAAPMIVSMIVQALYNVVDTIFVSSLGTDALTALSLAFSLQNLMISVAVGTGVGVNATLSKHLGAKEFDKANKTAVNGIFLAFVSFIAFMLVGVFLARPYFSMFGASEGVIEYGVSYISIVCGVSIGLFGQVMFERLLQAVGLTFYTMITQSVGAIINIILDPILIYGFFGLPAMGVTGAAIATVFGQIVALCLAALFNLKFNSEISIKLKGFKPDGKTIKRIYSIGFPSIIMGSIGSIMTMGINQIIRLCGDVAETAQAVFGLYFKLQSFVFMPVFGLNNGMVPIIAYNYGARNRERMMKTVKLSVIYACSMMLIGFIIFQTIPETLLNLFKTDVAEDMASIIAIGVPALRIISYSFLFAGFCIVTLSVFQALGHGFLSLMVSVLRQLVVLLPVAFILAYTTRSLNIMWLSFPIAEIASVLLSGIFLVKLYEKEIKTL